MGQCTWSLHRKRLASASGVRSSGWSRAGEHRKGEGTAPQSPGIPGGAAQRSLGSWGGALGPGVDPRAHGWSRALEPGDQGGASSCGSDNSNSSTFKPGARHRRRRLGTRVRSAFITYRRERALVLQGPGDGGTRRVSVAQVGAGACALWGGSGSLLPGKADWSQTAWLQGSHFPGAGWTLGGFHRISCRVPAALFSQRHLSNSRHHYFTQDAPVLARRAGKNPGGASEEKRGRGKGKRRRRRRHAARSFLEPPPTPPPSPFRVRNHPTSSRSPASSSGTHRWTSR